MLKYNYVWNSLKHTQYPIIEGCRVKSDITVIIELNKYQGSLMRTVLFLRGQIKAEIRSLYLWWIRIYFCSVQFIANSDLVRSALIGDVGKSDNPIIVFTVPNEPQTDVTAQRVAVWTTCHVTDMLAIPEYRLPSPRIIVSCQIVIS